MSPLAAGPGHVNPQVLCRIIDREERRFFHFWDSLPCVKRTRRIAIEGRIATVIADRKVTCSAIPLPTNPMFYGRPYQHCCRIGPPQEVHPRHNPAAVGSDDAETL